MLLGTLWATHPQGATFLDGSKGHKAKIFSLDQSTLWVEALMPGTEGISSSDTITFQAASIDFVRALGPRASLIRLKSGTDIALRMPQPVLMDKLQNPDGALLDLKGVSYVETKAALLERLQADFRKEAEREKYAALEEMTFRVFVRASNQTNFREFTFRGCDANLRDMQEGGSIMGGNNLRLAMKDAAKGPFGGADFIIEGTLNEFRAMALEAHARGERELDLRDHSLRKGTTPPDQKPAPTKAPGP